MFVDELVEALNSGYYSVFVFIALQRYGVLSLIMNNLNYRCCTLFNQKLL
jgi:hypothetical protein